MQFKVTAKLEMDCKHCGPEQASAPARTADKMPDGETFYVVCACGTPYLIEDVEITGTVEDCTKALAEAAHE
jgi:hypothetical protein